MSWTAITTADVLDEITPGENATLNNVQGATSNLARILTRAISKFRGAVQAGGQTLGGDGLLPESLHDDCVAYARWRFLTSIPQAKNMQTAERKAAYDEAIKVLEALRNGDFSVEAEDPETSAPRGGAWGSQARIKMRTDNPHTET